jgi:hypothetical protein
MFWVFIGITVLAVIGLSVWAGKALSGPKGESSVSRREQVTALKASGALRHRKSNRP